ncbi:MAG: S41 family peptidase [Anaerolineales bacterium]|nr:S41 family peptidase [Anaerolineales bacterium]
MKQNIIEGLLTFFLGMVLFVSGYMLGQSRYAPISMIGLVDTTPTEVREEFVPFWEVYDYLNEEYYDQPLDQSQLVEGAINGMLATLGDPNTAYLSPEEQAAMQNAMDGELQGIGAEVQAAEDGAITIVSPFEGSPAAEAGLLPRDILREADGVPLTGMDVAEAAARVRGPAGTAVELLVERNGETFNITIIRGVIDLPSVTSEMLADNIGYIRLSRFANNTTDELNEALEEILPQANNGLILDLRRNPGGALTAVVDIADLFLPENTILIERFGDGEEVTYTADDGDFAEQIPLVVLVDEGSASASEVLAGAIQDTGRGIVIGQDTFGKGTVQNWLPLRNGGGVRVTIARWLTPDGTWVHETGVAPDVVVLLPEVTAGMTADEFEDIQLNTAVEYLLNQ